MRTYIKLGTKQTSPLQGEVAFQESKEKKRKKKDKAVFCFKLSVICLSFTE